jgi:DNA-binding MarR family transcriptional regulator
VSAQDTDYLYGLLKRAARELERLEAVGLSRARAQLRSAHIAVLSALLEATPLTPSELCVRCELEPSTMTGLLRALEREGLIERAKVILDQRSQQVQLTAKGRKIAKEAVRTRVAAQRAVLRKLPRTQARRLSLLLSRFVGAAAEAADTAVQKQALPRTRVRAK